MRAPRLIQGLEMSVFALLAAMHVCLYLWSPSLKDLEPHATLLREAAFPAQWALLSSWAVLGPGRRALRWPAVLVLMLGLAVAAPHLFPTQQKRDWLVSLCFYDVGMLLAALLVWRCRGFGVSTGDFTDSAAPGPRFSIRSLMLLTTAVAVALWLGPRLRASATADSTISAGNALASLGVPAGILAALSLWAVLSPGGAWWRVAAVGLLAPAMGLFAPYLFAKEADRLVCMEWLSLQTAVLMASLAPVRWCGFRLFNVVSFRGGSHGRSLNPARSDPDCISLPRAVELHAGG